MLQQQLQALWQERGLCIEWHLLTSAASGAPIAASPLAATSTTSSGTTVAAKNVSRLSSLTTTTRLVTGLVGETCAHLQSLAAHGHFVEVGRLVRAGTARAVVGSLASAMTLFKQLSPSGAAGGGFGDGSSSSSSNNNNDSSTASVTMGRARLDGVRSCVEMLHSMLDMMREQHPDVWQTLLAEGVVEWVTRMAVVA